MIGFKIVCTVLFIVFLDGVKARVFWETVESATERLQQVPPIAKTAKKIETYLLERSSQSPRLVKRAIKKPEDVLIVIDSSKSVPKANFTQGIRALKNLVTRFRPSTNFAAILFSTKAKVIFPFIAPRKAMEKLLRIKYEGGFTNTQAALRKSGKLLTSRKSGVRDFAYKRMFILTDGQSNIKKKHTLYLAYLLKEMGVEVFVMAVGERIEGINELAMLATSTNRHLYRVADMDQFLQVVDEIPHDPNYDEYEANAFN